MDSHPNRPLITFGLIAYNQERFIREAVASTLAQTYSPLQVILSDDNSPDRTFDIMREMAASYQGPHEIILNRNATNQGLGGHINEFFKLAKGELFVLAAGDDVSLPERVEALFRAWDEAGRPVCAIYSDVMETSEDGTPIHKTTSEAGKKNCLWEVFNGIKSPVIGCSEAWHRKLYDFYGPLASNIVNEDGAMWFRAELSGCIVHVPQVLVRHRIHGTNTGSGGFAGPLNARSWLQANATSMRRQAAVIKGNINDLKCFRDAGNTRPDMEKLDLCLKKWERFTHAGQRLCEGNSPSRLKWVPSYARNALVKQHWTMLPHLIIPGISRLLRTGSRRMRGQAGP